MVLAKTETYTIHVKALNDCTEFKLCQNEQVNTDTSVSLLYIPTV